MDSNKSIEANKNDDYQAIKELLKHSEGIGLDSKYLTDMLLNPFLNDAELKYVIITKLTAERVMITPLTNETKTRISDNLFSLINSLLDNDKVSATYKLGLILPDKSKPITMLSILKQSSNAKIAEEAGIALTYMINNHDE
jgi:hypothetical protein